VVGRDVDFLMLLPVVGLDLLPPSLPVLSGTTLFRSFPLTARVTFESFSVKLLDMDRPVQHGRETSDIKLLIQKNYLGYDVVLARACAPAYELVVLHKLAAGNTATHFHSTA
jgi:hypothetical protein